jgi:hypothetical protein
MIIDAIMRQIGNTSAAESMQNAVSNAERTTNKYYNKAEGYQQPYAEQGQKFYNTLGNMIRFGEFDMPADARYTEAQYQEKPFDFQADPGYQFRMQQGAAAVQGSAAAKGGALSGATMRALAKYGQNLASQEYSNAYNRYSEDRSFNRGNFESDRTFGYNSFSDRYNRMQTNANNKYNMYNNMANTGVGASNTLADLASRRGDALANYDIQRGNISAQQSIARSQAMDGAANVGYNALGTYFGGGFGGQK